MNSRITIHLGLIYRGRLTARCEQGQILNVAPKCVTNLGLNSISTLTGIFNNDVPDIVNYENIITETPDHGISTTIPIQGVVTGTAIKSIGVVVSKKVVIQCITSAINCTVVY